MESVVVNIYGLNELKYLKYNKNLIRLTLITTDSI